MLLKINLTIDTKACPCITGQFGTITIFLLFAWFSACVSHCVTYLTISAVRIFIAFLKAKYEPLVGVIENRYSPCSQKPVLVSQVCLVPLQSFFSSQGFLHVFVSVSHIFPFLHSVLSSHPWNKMYLKLVLFNVTLTNNTIAYAYVTGLFFTLTIFLFFT